MSTVDRQHQELVVRQAAYLGRSLTSPSVPALGPGQHEVFQARLIHRELVGRAEANPLVRVALDDSPQDVAHQWDAHRGRCQGAETEGAPLQQATAKRLWAFGRSR